MKKPNDPRWPLVKRIVTFSDGKRIRDVKIVDLCQKVDNQVKLNRGLPSNPRKMTTSLMEQYNSQLVQGVRAESALL